MRTNITTAFHGRKWLRLLGDNGPPRKAPPDPCQQLHVGNPWPRNLFRGKILNWQVVGWFDRVRLQFVLRMWVPAPVHCSKDTDEHEWEYGYRRERFQITSIGRGTARSGKAGYVNWFECQVRMKSSRRQSRVRRLSHIVHLAAWLSRWLLESKAFKELSCRAPSWSSGGVGPYCCWCHLHGQCCETTVELQ